jgi:hypothetical protein
MKDRIMKFMNNTEYVSVAPELIAESIGEDITVVREVLWDMTINDRALKTGCGNYRLP